MNNLKTGRINLNNIKIVRKIEREIQKILNDKKSYFTLRMKKSFSFKTSKSLPKESDWYIILHRKSPLYVGRTRSLNSRLNTIKGGLDNFRNSGRKSDGQRNFIKKFYKLKIFRTLKDCVIREKRLCEKLKLNRNNLEQIDKRNIEKLLNIFRGKFHYI